MASEKSSWNWKSLLFGSCWPGGCGSVDSRPAARPAEVNGTSGSSHVNVLSSALFSPEDLSLTLAGSNLHAFTIAELKAVTRNFSTTNMIGSGGFGPVYKGFVGGELRPGLPARHVAVKSLDPDGLVKLIGYCCEDEHRMLVYEYMPRGSLESHL